MNVERRKAPRSMILILLLVSFWLPIAVAAEEQNAVAPRPAPAAAKAASSEDGRSKRPINSTQPGIEAKGGVEEIVVTAQKRSELVQDVPISLTAFGADNLAFRGISDIGDLALQVPGVTFGKDTGADQHIAIRGVSLDDSSASIEAPIATYVDGVYQTRSFRAPTLGVDLKRIEVLRGPQGTLFGRNATGGAINIVLEDPTEEYTSKVKVGAGSYGAARMEGVASGPIIKTTLLGRVSAAFDRDGGYVKNYFTGRYFNDHTSGTGRIALRYRPTEVLTADFSVILNKIVGGGVPAPTVNILCCSSILEAQNQVAPIETDPTKFINGHHPWKVKLNDPMQGDLENSQEALTLKYDLPWFSIKSISAFQEHSLSNFWDSDGTAENVVLFRSRRASTKALTQEVNATGTHKYFDWLVGTYFMNEHFVSDFNPIFVGHHLEGLGATLGAEGHEWLESYSLFGDATVKLPWHFKAFGGLRFTHDGKKTIQTVYLRPGTNNGSLLTQTGPAITQAPGTCEKLQFDDRFRNLSPRYGLSWEPIDEVNVYAKESFGYNPGGHYFNGCNDGYKAETLDTVEIGAKTRWFGGRLVGNVSLFASEFHDFQIFKVIGTSSVVVNSPLAKMQGGEFELVAVPIEQLTINAGVSLLHSYYVSYHDINVANENFGQNGATIPALMEENLSGHQLNTAPNHTESLGLEYALPIPNHLAGLDLKPLPFNTLRVRGEWYHTDYIVFRPFAGEGYGGAEDKQKNYSLFNAYATFTSRDDRYQLRFYGKNLTNYEYFGYKIAAAWGQRLGVGGLPRWFGVELTATF